MIILTAYNTCALNSRRNLQTGDQGDWIRCAGNCGDPQIDSQNCGGCRAACPTFPQGPCACVTGRCTLPIVISWAHTSSGLLDGLPGGWTVSNEGNTICFSIQDSANCGGPNGNTQSGTAEATITISQEYTFVHNIIGNGELQDTQYEKLSIFLYIFG